MRMGVATYVIGNPGYHRATEAIPGVPYPKAVRDYDAVELVGRKLLDRNWALTASYVWSRLYGNYSGLSQSDENGRTDPNIGMTFDAPLALFDGDGRALYGRLATDRPHQAKAQLIYTAPFGVNIGLFQSVASGLPVSRWTVLSPGIAPVLYAGRGSDGRTPMLSQTDLSVQYVAALGGRRRLTLGLNVLNLFNQAQGVGRFSSETDQGAPGRGPLRPTTTQDGSMWALPSTTRSCAIPGSSCTRPFRSPSRPGSWSGSVSSASELAVPSPRRPAPRATRADDPVANSVSDTQPAHLTSLRLGIHFAEQRVSRFAPMRSTWPPSRTSCI